VTTRTALPAAPPSTSALDALLATESEIAQRLADADREARTLLDAAHADIAAAAAETVRQVAAALAAIEARSARDVAGAVETIERDAEQAVRRYRTLDDAEVATIAADIVARSSGLGAAT